MLARSRSMRHQLYYYVCCYPRRDADCRSHLHHHFPRDSPTPSPVRCYVLEPPEASILTYLRLVCVVSSVREKRNDQAGNRTQVSVYLTAAF